VASDDPFFAPYDDNFFAEMSVPNYRRCQRYIGKNLWELTDFPEVVMDVGCGTGQMLRAIRDAGAKAIMGVESPQGIARCRNLGILELEDDEVYCVDLRYTKFGTSHTFALRPDLIICFEVFEHLPEEVAVDTMAGIQSIKPSWIAASGAVPFQGGTGHINEHPVEYWHRLAECSGDYLLDTTRSAWLRNRVMEYPGMFPWARNLYIYRRRIE